MPMAITAAQLAVHSTEADCWVAVHGRVYNVTSFLSEHPGGAAALSKPGRAGCDVTSHFERIGHSSAARKRFATFFVGELEDGALAAESPQKGTEREQSHAAVEWHASRRRAMLEAHPELESLAGDNSFTPFIGLFASTLHAWLCVRVSTLGQCLHLPVAARQRHYLLVPKVLGGRSLALFLRMMIWLLF